MMKTHLAFLAVSLGAACLPACASSGDSQPIGSSGAHGDLAPAKLYTVPATHVAHAREALSRPVAGKEGLAPPKEYLAQHTKEGTLDIAAGVNLTDFKLPITATDGTRVAVGAFLEGREETSKALHETRLTAPGGTAIEPTVMLPHAATAKEPAGTMPLHTGVWALDAKSPSGDFALTLGPAIQTAGGRVHIFEPASSIDMALLTVTPLVAAGTVGTVRVTLMDGTMPITGAALRAHLATATNQNGPVVAMRELGSGVYEGNVSDALTANDPSDIYTLKVDATGTSAGKGFVRSGATAFTYVVSTGRIATVGAPRLVRDASKKVEAFEADFDVEVASADRFEITALLTRTGDDGLEHPVAEAQTADDLIPGTHTVTLSFDAGYPQVFGADGELHVRKVTLFSQGHRVLMQREEGGFGLAFPTVHVTELKPLAVVPPGLQRMLGKTGEVHEGALPGHARL